MYSLEQIAGNVGRLLHDLPEHVILEAAVKGRTAAEVAAAVDGGVNVIGENYLDQAEEHLLVIGDRIRWHFIGHLQRNKISRIVRLFDMIETVDCMDLACRVDRACARLGRSMPVLVEVNSGREPQKSGVISEDVDSLVRQMARLAHIRVMGLMTMGPQVADEAEMRACFTLTRQLAENISRLSLSGVEMKYLSMGMSGSYRLAIEEGANIVRIGEAIFGPRR